MLGLEVACGNVVHHGVAENAGGGVALAHILAVAADDDGKLGLVVQTGHDVRVGGNEVVRAARLVGALAEIGRLLAVEQERLAVELGALVGVRGVVDAKTDDVLLGVRNGRADADGGQAQRCALDGRLGVGQALLFGRGDAADEVGHVAVGQAEVAYISDKAGEAGKLDADALYTIAVIKRIEFHINHTPWSLIRFLLYHSTDCTK